MRSIKKRHFQITSYLTELYLFPWQFISEDTFLCFSKEECILAMCSPGHISVVAGHQLNRHSVIINSTLNSKLTHLLLIKKNLNWTPCEHGNFVLHIRVTSIYIYLILIHYTKWMRSTLGKNHLKKVFHHELTWEYPKNLHFHYQSLQTARRLDNYSQLILYHKIRDH